MSKTLRVHGPDQTMLLPASLPAYHLVYFLLDIVESMFICT